MRNFYLKKVRKFLKHQYTCFFKFEIKIYLLFWNRMASDGDEWKSFETRQRIIERLDEQIKEAPGVVTKTAVEIEKQVG